MSRRSRITIVAAVLAIGLTALAVWPITAFQPVSSEDQMLAQGKFQFTVVESFDGKYLGDTPGHLGRGGKLEGRRPHVGLGDPVFNDQQTVGAVTRVEWDRARGGLEIEFSPAPLARVATGDTVWVWLDGVRAAEE